MFIIEMKLLHDDRPIWNQFMLHSSLPTNSKRKV